VARTDVTRAGEPPTAQQRPIGFGPLLRKEDARFIRGRGTRLALDAGDHRVDARAAVVDRDEPAHLHHRRAGSLMDYLIPTALDVPDWETDFTVTPSPHHPIGAKGIGESATVGSPPAIVNAICDALAPYGVRHVDMPCTPSRVWDAMRGKAEPRQ
jgi:hypothetical protein